MIDPDQQKRIEEVTAHCEAIFYTAMWVVNSRIGAEQFANLVEEVKRAHATDMIEGTKTQQIERIRENFHRMYREIIKNDPLFTLDFTGETE